MLSKSAALSSSPPSLFSFLLSTGLFKNWLPLAVQTSPERPPDPPSVVRRSSSQLQLACFGCYLLTEGLMMNSEQLYLLCWEEAERVFMLRQRRMKPGAGALFTRRTRLACSRPRNNIQLLSPAGRQCVSIC